MAHRYATENGINLVKSFEGFRAAKYICPAGFWTIGYGHALKKGEKFDTLGVINESEAEEVLKSDLYSAEASVQRLIAVPLEDYQFDALVDFTFNLGGGALQRSTLRSKLNRYEYIEAADEFPKWVWGGGKKQPGLIRRRDSERNLFLIGIAYEKMETT